MVSVLAGAISYASFAVIANAAGGRGLAERAWVIDDASLISSYQARPLECLKPSSGRRLEQQRLGRIVFNSPRLLGGQAGRMGLSCASCHVSGRGNQHFFVKQISTVQGTADISHSFLSSNGGDGTLNAKPIPDLAKRETGVFQSRTSEAFANHVMRLVELEFDGQPATQIVFQALMVYLQDLDSAYCQNGPSQTKPKQFDDDWRLIDDSISLLRQSKFSRKISQDRKLILDSARAQLEVIYQHFGLYENSKIDQRLIRLSRQLNELTDQVDETNFLFTLDKLSQAALETKLLLEQHVDRSAYHAESLKAYLTVE